MNQDSELPRRVCATDARPTLTPETLWWAGFVGAVLALLALDLGVFHRKSHEVKMREALTWVGVWMSLAFLFGLGIYLGWIGPYADQPRNKTRRWSS